MHGSIQLFRDDAAARTIDSRAAASLMGEISSRPVERMQLWFVAASPSVGRGFACAGEVGDVSREIKQRLNFLAFLAMIRGRENVAKAPSTNIQAHKTSKLASYKRMEREGCFWVLKIFFWMWGAGFGILNMHLTPRELKN